MQRPSPAVLWTSGAGLLALSITVAAAQVNRGAPARDTSQTVRVYEGVSTEGDFQQALDRAVGRALRAMPGADRMIQYRVREITGEQGGIRGVNTIRVAIEVNGEEGRAVEPEPPVRPERPAPTPEEEQADQLRDALRTQVRVVPARAARGEQVTLELTVRNTSNRPVRVPFATGQQYDFEVWRGDRLVYRWSQGRVFTQALSSLLLNPDQSITYTGRWDQRNNEGVRVPAGEYTVRGYLPTRLPDLRPGESTTLTIR
ncbi:MAG TPA: BsuPI-related putative proteinase inhibitor [Armatimonadota bacterium]|nr:BsuPI-related putative proteinase inhibitor [Armatimonadota bacterium]